MAADATKETEFEIGHVLFIDIVGYSKLLIEEQKERLGQLTKIVLGTAQVRDSTDEQLVRLPTGDGMALVFRHSAEEPAQCALEIAEALRKHPEIRGADGHSQRAGERSDRRERSHQHRRGWNQHGAAGDGLRRCRSHSSLETCGGRLGAIRPLAAAPAQPRRVRGETRRASWGGQSLPRWRGNPQLPKSSTRSSSTGAESVGPKSPPLSCSWRRSSPRS